MRVGLYVPCYIDQFYPKVGVSTLELLEKSGCEVVFNPRQTCCGQPMANSGFQHLTHTLDVQNKELFPDCQAVVCPSGSCTLHLKEHVFPKDLLVYELSEFLTDIVKVEDLKAYFPYRVGIHQSCHGLRGLKLAKSSELVEEPYSKIETLLSHVKGLKIKIPEKVDECCGFGGTFSVNEEPVSAKMGQDKCAEFETAEVDYITSADMSCLMHIEGILKREGKQAMKVIHLAEILNSQIE